MRTLILLFLIICCLSSCKVPFVLEDPKPTTSNFTMVPGDIVVSNTGNDSLILLDSDGNFKDTLLDVVNGSETIYGIGWLESTNELIVTVDGSDRVMAISAFDGEVRTFITNANLAGTLRGITQLTGGDILIIESNNVERFTTNAVRVTSGWPITGIMTTPEQIDALSNGGFVACSRGTDEVRTYTSAGVQVNSTASGVGGTTDGYGCIEMTDGRIATVWVGTTDSVIIFNAALSSAVATYSDTSLLGNPRGIAQAKNGNLLIVDATLHHIVEIDTTATFVRTLGSSTLSTPQHIFVIPDYL